MADFIGIIEHMFPDPKAAPSLLVGVRQVTESLPASFLVTRWVRLLFSRHLPFSRRRGILFLAWLFWTSLRVSWGQLAQTDT